MSQEKIARDMREGVFPKQSEPKVQGVGRVADNKRAILVSTNVELTDDELRSLHDHLRGWRADRD